MAIKSKQYKIPAKPGACADLLYKLRQERYDLQHQVDALEDHERAIRDHLIATLPTSGATGIAGKAATVSITVSNEPTAEDWEAIVTHMRTTGEFDLIQRRLSAPAVKARWEDGKAVPGVGVIVVKKVSVTKL